MSLDDVYTETENKMKKAIEAVRNDFSSIRTGRATPALLDRLHVDSYGQMVPIKQVASVSSPDARSLVIAAFDRNQVGAIRKAIETSDLGMNPNVDGSQIRLNIPPLNEERRKDLAKIVRKKGEDGKVAIRNIRQKGNDEIKGLVKAGTATDDAAKRGNEHIQKMTDRYIKEVDTIVAAKEKEIMEV
jgi:ribosome recycling factor